MGRRPRPRSGNYCREAAISINYKCIATVYKRIATVYKRIWLLTEAFLRNEDVFEKSSAVGYYDDPNIEYWEEHYDKKSNDTYWFNTKTGESSWEVPDEISDFHHRRKYEGANHDSIQEFHEITNSNSNNDEIKKNAHMKIADTEADWETYRV